MTNLIDARGLSCPQPVIMTVDAIKSAGKDELTVLVDTDTAKENISRAVNGQGWSVLEIEPDEGGYRIKIGQRKGSV